jgi:hypothetical protein
MDRTYVQAANLPAGIKPVWVGWQFSTLVVLPQQNSSWTYVLDNQRIKREDPQASVMATQLREALPLLPACPLWLGESYYGSAVFLALVADLPCDLLIRLAKNRVLYREPPARSPATRASHQARRTLCLSRPCHPRCIRRLLGR